MSALDRATSIFGWLISVEIAAISVGTCSTYVGMVPHCGRDAPQQKRDDGNEMMLLDPTKNLDSSGALRNSGNQGRFDLTLPIISGSVPHFNGVRNGAVSEELKTSELQYSSPRLKPIDEMLSISLWQKESKMYLECHAGLSE